MRNIYLVRAKMNEEIDSGLINQTVISSWSAKTGEILGTSAHKVKRSRARSKYPTLKLALLCLWNALDNGRKHRVDAQGRIFQYVP